MTTVIIIMAIVVWFIGAILMRMMFELPGFHGETLGWKLSLSALWPIVVPVVFLAASITTFCIIEEWKS